MDIIKRLKETRIDKPEDWRDAVRRARDGDPGRLANLVERHIASIPEDVQLELAIFIADPVPRKKRPGVKRRVTEAQADRIRYWFKLLTTPDDDSEAPLPLSGEKAREQLGKIANLSRDTIRDIVERRKTYEAKPWSLDGEIADRFSQHLRRKR